MLGALPYHHTLEDSFSKPNLSMFFKFKSTLRMTQNKCIPNARYYAFGMTLLGFSFDFLWEKEIIRTVLKQYNFRHRMPL